MATLNEWVFEVNEWPRVPTVKRKIALIAKNMGFAEREVGEITISVSELAENLVAHDTVEGKIICSVIEECNRKGIQILSEDRGPGFADSGKVLKDGYSRKGTLGIGLGAVKRVMDEFDIHSKTMRSKNAGYEDAKEGIGTVILARKWLEKKEDKKKAPGCTTRFGISCRPKEGEQCNGDTFFLRYFGNKVMAAVIDGVGHGPHAEEAARAAHQILTDNAQKSLEVIMPAMHEGLKKTRGAAVSLALIDGEGGILEYAGIGNVVTRVFNSAVPVRPANYNGTIGVALRKFKVFTYPWSRDSVLVMASDGISDKYDPERYPGLINNHPGIIADIIMRDYRRQHDDATVVVGRPI